MLSTAYRQCAKLLNEFFVVGSYRLKCDRRLGECCLKRGQLVSDAIEFGLQVPV